MKIKVLMDTLVERGKTKPAGSTIEVSGAEGQAKIDAGLAEAVGKGKGKDPDPDGADAAHEQIVAYMSTLEVPEDPTGSEYFTDDGKPHVTLIESALGIDVSAEARDRAWAAVQGK